MIEMRAGTWRNPLTADVWRSSFRRLVSPVIRGRLISAVTSADVLSVLTPIWNDGRQETARRLWHRIGAVLRWSIGAGHRTDNPAGEAISEALPKNGTACEAAPARASSSRRGRRACQDTGVQRVGSNQAAVGVHDFDSDAIRRGPAGDLERGRSPGWGLDGTGRENEGRSSASGTAVNVGA